MGTDRHLSDCPLVSQSKEWQAVYIAVLNVSGYPTAKPVVVQFGAAWSSPSWIGSSDYALDRCIVRISKPRCARGILVCGRVLGVHVTSLASSLLPLLLAFPF